MRIGMLALLGVVLAAEAGAAETGGYLFVTFRGEASPMTEQVYFLVSEDGRAWQALNKAEPVLVSTLGEKGVRDERRKAITMERSEHLMSGWQEIEAFTLADMTGYEGPTCFQIEPAEAGRPARWRLLLDWYARGRGYQPYETDELRTGNFVPGTPMDFPFHPVRHGTVLPLSTDELQRLQSAWIPPAEAELRGSATGAVPATR